MAKFDSARLAPLNAPAFTGNIAAKNAATFTTAGASATDRDVLVLNNPFVGGNFTGCRVIFQGAGVDAATVYGTLDGAGAGIGGKLFLRTFPPGGGAAADGLTIDSAQTVVINKQFDMPEIAAPASPVADTLRMYVKDVAGVSHLFTKNSAGLETDLNLGGGGGGVSVTVSATAPVAPTNGSLWYDLTTGVMAVYVNDGNSSQWTQVSPVPALVWSGPLGSGRLEYVSTTALKFAPYGGNQIKINGAFYTIPTTGLPGLTTTNAWVENLFPRSVVANTTYLVFAKIDAGAVVVNFQSGVGHVTSTLAGNEGVEVMDLGGGANPSSNLFTLIGMCRTNASAQFQDDGAHRFVRSWFNCRQVSLISASPYAGDTTTSTTWVEISAGRRCEFVKWAGEVVDLLFNGSHFNNTLGMNVMSCIGIDGTTPASPEVNYHAAGASFRSSIGSRYTDDALSEGYHYATGLGAVGGQTGSWPSPQAAGGLGPRITGFLGGL